MTDTEDGAIETKFVADTPLPTDPTQYTPAQRFVCELKIILEKMVKAE